MRTIVWGVFLGVIFGVLAYVVTTPDGLGRLVHGLLGLL